MGKGRALRFLRRDIGFGTGGAGLCDGIGSQVAGSGNQSDLIDGQRCKGGERQRGILRNDLLNQGGLAQRDLVLLREGRQFGILRDALGEHRGFHGVILENSADGLTDGLLKLGGTIRIVVFHRDQNGVLQVVQVAVLDHGTDQGVDGDLQIGSFQLHIAQNDLGILVQRVS